MPDKLKPTKMNFGLTEDQKMIQQMAKDFAEKEIRPYLMDWDESQEFPAATLRKMGEQGLMGMLVPEQYGGAGLGYIEYSIAIQEIRFRVRK